MREWSPGLEDEMSGLSDRALGGSLTENKRVEEGVPVARLQHRLLSGTIPNFLLLPSSGLSAAAPEAGVSLAAMAGKPEATRRNLG